MPPENLVSPPFRIRRPRAADAAAVARLAQRLPELDRYATYLYLLLCDHFTSTCALLEQGGEIAGFITGYVRPDASDTLFVWQVGVAPEAHRQGVATRLLRALFERPENRGLCWLETTVSPDNLASRRLFARFAAHVGAPLAELPGYAPELFTEPHPPEPLLRIGPIRWRSA